MARLQILELPEGGGGDRAPFVLVVDETVPQRVALGSDVPYRDYWQDIAQQIGARAVIITPETVEIPANDTTAYLSDEGSDGTTVGAVRVRVEPDFEQFREQVQAEIIRAQQELKQAINRDA